MRKWNGILTGVIFVLFLLHGILGGFQLLGSGHVISRTLAHILAALVILHVILGTILTVQTLQIQKQTGAPYWKKTRLFWARRLSGFLVMSLLLFHVTAFSDRTSSAFRLLWFNEPRLIAQLLLVLALAVHILSNIRPALITFGIRPLKDRAGDLIFIMTVLLLFMSAAFIVYYLRWNTI